MTKEVLEVREAAIIKSLGKGALELKRLSATTYEETGLQTKRLPSPKDTGRTVVSIVSIPIPVHSNPYQFVARLRLKVPCPSIPARSGVVEVNEKWKIDNETWFFFICRALKVAGRWYTHKRPS